MIKQQEFKAKAQQLKAQTISCWGHYRFNTLDDPKLRTYSQMSKYIAKTNYSGYIRVYFKSSYWSSIEIKGEKKK